MIESLMLYLCIGVLFNYLSTFFATPELKVANGQTRANHPLIHVIVILAWPLCAATLVRTILVSE